MARTHCPHCRAALSEYESKSVQCPHCGGYFESQMPGAARQPRVIPARPVHARPTVRRASTSSSGSGWGGAWWVAIPITLVAIRACISVSNTSSPPPPKIDFEKFNIPPYTIPERDFSPPQAWDDADEENQRVQEILQEILRRRMEADPYQYDPPDEPPDEPAHRPLDEGLLDAEIDEPPALR